MDKTLSVVIPVYNEAQVIEAVIRDFYNTIIKKVPHSVLIIAEDGSTDGTKEVLERLQKELPFELISGQARKGYTRAFKDALALAKTDLIFFSDSDAQHDAKDFFTLLDEIGTNDIVGGYKSPRRDPLHRLALSCGYNFLIHLLFGLKTKDIDAGFKLMKREVVDSVLPEVRRMKYCVMSEFIICASMKGYRFIEVPVAHHKRGQGATSIFHPAKLPGIVFGLLKNLLQIKFQYRKKETL